METAEESCRWGILGTASIAKKNWHSIINAGNSRIVAVGSRSGENAQRFIDECQASVPTAYPVEAVSGYEALIARKDIDALYIPLPTTVRTEWAVTAAAAGKHIVIEKPCGIDATDLQRIVDAADASGVQVMDGVMFQHSSRLQSMRSILDDDTSVGDIRRIASHFSFVADDAWIQRNSLVEPAGCLGDIGWYNIRLILFALNYAMPVEVRGRILNGVQRSDGSGVTPIEFEGTLQFAGGVTATLYNAFDTSRQQWAYISGSKGYLHLKDFVLPHYGNEVSFTVGNDSFGGSGCYFNLERHERTIALQEYSNNHPSAQETGLFRTFADLVLTGKRDRFWPDVAMKTQRILDTLLESANAGGVPIVLA
ncbi:Gfo/Idh/MocA family oxidoreductase [Burkholderia sp. Ac-20345]|uniref:Gfo/Idh/MocA family protein n=1 Tax=Burkholderia sp. Ac-20345 TaxID=2703891 RepID=UPI00197B1286|nr:Gfo/Idh/MocA family oxidoreductase [Burkholderia sp. Ac-20345]MBN3779388.1 Gfo/Idh/MocA family oxidoreductase [Burkholderia sp. Ac-20345]